AAGVVGELAEAVAVGEPRSASRPRPSRRGLSDIGRLTCGGVRVSSYADLTVTSVGMLRDKCSLYWELAPVLGVAPLVRELRGHFGTGRFLLRRLPHDRPVSRH